MVWESKSPEGDGKNTIKHQFDGTSKQADKVILDLRRIKMPAEKAERQAMSRFDKSINIKRLLLITKDGKVLLKLKQIVNTPAFDKIVI